MAETAENVYKGVKVETLAVGTETRDVQINFTPEELSVKKDEYFLASDELAKLEEELQGIKESFKEQMKPLKKDLADLRTKIKNQGYFEEQLCYLVDDQEMGMMNYLLEDGTLVFSRRLTATERQLAIKPTTNVHPIEKQ